MSNETKYSILLITAGFVLGSLCTGAYSGHQIYKLKKTNIENIEEVKSKDFNETINAVFGTIVIQTSGKTQLEAEIEFMKKINQAKSLRWRELGEKKQIVGKEYYQISQLMFRFSD